jgi:hypothetical protein
MSMDEPPKPGQRTMAENGNFVRSLEAPKYGFDRYVEEKLANAGGRILKGKGNKGAVYMNGHFKGLTEGQAREKIRQGYASMSDEARAPYERGAQGADVMSAREQVNDQRFYNARGVVASKETEAAQAGTMSRDGKAIAAASDYSASKPAPRIPMERLPAGQAKSPVNPRAITGSLINDAEKAGRPNAPAPRAPGAINGTPVDLRRAMGASKNPLSVPPPMTQAPSPGPVPVGQGFEPKPISGSLASTPATKGIDKEFWDWLLKNPEPQRPAPKPVGPPVMAPSDEMLKKKQMMAGK